jgi:hypothetical protein
MGALTSDRDDGVPRNPLSETGWWTAYGHTGWLDDLKGFSPPTAVLLSKTIYEERCQRITDDDVDQLADVLGKLPSVRVVSVGGTRLSDDGVRRLQAKLSNCQVAR